MRSESDTPPAFIALMAFAVGVLATVAVQYGFRRIERAREGARPGKMDALITSRRYEPRASRRIAADDPWEHYEEVLG
jgi:hypothetical protein